MAKKSYRYAKNLKEATTVKFSIRKEIFIARGRKTTCYSLGKNVVGYARIYYATKQEAQKALRKIQAKRSYRYV